MDRECNETRSYIACGQKFLATNNDASLISIIKKFAESRAQAFQKSRAKGYYIEDIDIPSRDCKISYLFAGRIVQIGVIDNKSNEIRESADPDISATYLLLMLSNSLQHTKLLP